MGHPYVDLFLYALMVTVGFSQYFMVLGEIKSVHPVPSNDLFSDERVNSVHSLSSTWVHPHVILFLYTDSQVVLVS